MKLDLPPFAKAIAQLKLSIDYCHSKLATSDNGVALQFRSAAILAFEYTYELSWKMLKRFLEMSELNPQQIDAMSFPELIHTGSERGLLLNDLTAWKLYRHARSITSHTYDELKSAEVYQIIPQFLADADHLYQMLVSRVEPS